MNQLSQQARRTIESLQHCHATCLSMAMTYCMETGGEHARPQHLRLMLDCAGLCAFTADTIARKSQFHSRAAQFCADVCTVCADDCEALGEMDDCVTACRDCARLCDEISRADHAAIIAEGASHAPSAA